MCQAGDGTFEGWDFADTWSLTEAETYPWLFWQQEAAGHNYPAELYTLALNTEPQEGGSVEGDGIYPENGLVVVTAASNPGYSFESWQDLSGGIVSTGLTHIFAMPSHDVTLTAVFSPNTITVEINPEGAGTVDIDPDKDYYGEFEDVMLTANANEGYEFAGWTDEEGNELGSYTTLYYYTQGESVTIIANFTLADYSLTVDVNPEGSGSVTINPEQEYYNMGDEITLTATSGGDDDYVFVNWKDTEDNEVSDQASFVYTMPARDISLTANFDIANIVIDPAQGGLTVSPVPATDFIFVESENLIKEIRLIDISGQNIMHIYVNGHREKIDVNSLLPGTYLLQVQTEPDGKVVTRRVVVSR